MAVEPRRLPMFPLSTVLFPGGLLPLHVFEPRYRTMIAECLEEEPHEFGVVLISRGSEVGGGDQRTDVGTVARIEGLRRSDDGRYAIVARGTTRIRVVTWLPDDPFPVALVEELPDVGADDGDGGGGGGGFPGAVAAVRTVEALMSEIGSSVPDQPVGADTPLWELCGRLPVNALDRQRLLVTDDPESRARLLVELADGVAGDLARLLAGG